MRARTLLNIGLIAGAAVMGALLWLDRPQEPKPDTLTPLRGEAIEQIRITTPEQPTIELSLTDSGWRLEAPVTTRADQATVNQILRLASTPSRRRMAAGQVDLAKLGLLEPVTEVQFDGTPAIQLGGSEAVKGFRYAQVGPDIHLINEPNMQALDGDYSDLISRRLLPPGARIIGLTLPERQLSRDDQGGWTAEPATDAISSDAAERTVDLWERTQAMWAGPADDEPAPETVVIETADHGRFTFGVVAREPQLQLRRDDLGVVFQVGANRAAPLLELTHAGASSLKTQPDVELTPAEE
ncbi:MAG: DUF4340 domain-containing protein [Salinisphaeraceae bacterium]